MQRNEAGLWTEGLRCHNPEIPDLQIRRQDPAVAPTDQEPFTAVLSKGDLRGRS